MNEMMKRSCPNCGTAMECKLQNFSIGADGGGGLMTLLADQYEVALNAKLETLDDGTIVMVMCEGQDEVFDAIVSAIEAA